jgi:hypothetical protein
MRKTLGGALVLLLSGAVCFGQSTFQGLTPGSSTRADVDRVLGQPKKQISPTLSEYAGGADATKIYVQFADESLTAEALRIELFCEGTYSCRKLLDKLKSGVRKPDAYKDLVPDPRYLKNDVYYWGPPVFVVNKFRQDNTENVQFYVGLYSKELYESAVPKSCTGMFSGVFDTNRGRMTLTRTPDPETASTQNYITGAYSAGKGKITAYEGFDQLDGEWKDETGSGTFSLKLPNPRTSFTGEWDRTTGKGPKKGTWEGRCVEAKAGGSN